MHDIIRNLEWAKETCGTQNTQGYKYSDNAETLAIKEAIKFINDNMGIYEDWRSKSK